VYIFVKWLIPYPVLHFKLCIHCSKGFLHGISLVNMLYFSQIHLSVTLPYPVPARCFSTAFSEFIMPSSHTDTMYSCIVTLCHHSSSPSSPSPIKQPHYCKYVLSLHLYYGVCVYLLDLSSTFKFLSASSYTHPRVLRVLGSTLRLKTEVDSSSRGWKDFICREEKRKAA
jgi:hypothetical protein